MRTMTPTYRSIVVCIALAISLFAPAHGARATIDFGFDRNLFLGVSGQDVHILQAFLNGNPDTRLAESGPGSPGHETDYFGMLTKRAVIIYQELHKSAALSPIGLSSGTGFVGPLTRALLNDEFQRSGSAATAVTSNSRSLTSPNSSSTAPTISAASTQEALVGDIVSLSGSFPDDVSITISGVSAHMTSHTSSTVSFIVPSPAHYGANSIIARSNAGESNPFFLAVRYPAVTRPQIDNITPKVISLGDELTIEGSGFMGSDSGAEGNELRTNYGVISPLESIDGTHLSFFVSRGTLPDLPPTLSHPYETTLYVYVVNAGGVSPSPASVTIEL